MDTQGSSSGGQANVMPEVANKPWWKVKLKPEIWAAIIGAAATIVAAVATIVTLVPTFTLSATSSFTTTPIGFTETPSLTITPSETISPTLTSTFTATASPTETLTLTPKPKLIVVLTASKNSGKKPLRVKFDARDSYLTELNGERYVCRDGACTYVWRVYYFGQPVGKAVNDSEGTFDYNFTKKGTYAVTVWICRGSDQMDCNGRGVQVIVS